MALRNSTPLKWTPSGVSDTLDASGTFPGAMAALTNLIPDRTTKGLWVCRPAAIQKTAYAGFATPLFVSCMMVVGTRVYGLISTQRNPGRDEPFCFDLVTGAFVVVGNVTVANTPLSPPAVGAWTPPRMALIGTKIIVTHVGYVGSANVFGWFDVSVAASPTWNAGNTAVNALPAVPVDVFNFRGRAYFAVNTATLASTPFSDILDPLTITLANQVITYDDNVPITAFGGLPLNSTQGAVVATLVVFKGASSMYYVTGDAAPAPGNLQRDKVAAATGTFAPNSICSTVRGLAFVSPEGLRVIGFQGNISDPIGSDGSGVAVPFIYAVNPSRIAAACNGETVKISVQNGNAPGTPNQEYWYDLTRQLWSGPHSLPASLLAPYSNTFVKTAIGVMGKLFQADASQSLTSVYVENGAQMMFAYTTTMLPDIEQMCENSVVESTVDLAYTAGTPAYTVLIGDENGVLYDTLQLAIGGNPVLWGQFNWGEAVWLGQAIALSPRNLAWHQPIVFRRAFVGITGECSGTAKFGSLRMRYEKLGYLQAAMGGSS